MTPVHAQPSTHLESEGLLHQQHGGMDIPLGKRGASTGQKAFREVGQCLHGVQQLPQGDQAEPVTASLELRQLKR